MLPVHRIKFSVLVLVVRNSMGQMYKVATIAGQRGDSDFAGDLGPAKEAKLRSPQAVWIDTVKKVYVADFSNGRVRAISESKIIDTVAGSVGTSGPGTFTTIAATSALIGAVRGICGNNAGFLYITSSMNNVKKLDLTTGILSNFIATAASGGGDTGDGGQATSAKINVPYGCSIDTSGNFFVTAFNSYGIRMVTAATTIITRYAGTGSVTIGSAGVSGPATAAILRSSSIFMDTTNTMYFGDSRTSQVKKITSSRMISIFAGTGTSGYTGDNVKATSASLPGVGIQNTADRSGNVFIGASDGDFNCVLRVDRVSSMLVRVAGTPTISSNWGDGGSATSAQLSGIRQLAEFHGDLYLPDQINSVIRQLILIHDPTSEPTTAPSRLPSESPTLTPSRLPTAIPTTRTPSARPSTQSPSCTPTQTPSTGPSCAPTQTPSTGPSCAPTQKPTLTPSFAPSYVPTLVLSESPTLSMAPSTLPSLTPSAAPTNAPVLAPTVSPTCSPSTSPSVIPTLAPSCVPALQPTQIPTLEPTVFPSIAPSVSPTEPPTGTPTLSLSPALAPSLNPSQSPTAAPSEAPTVAPTESPSTTPSMDPTVTPTEAPIFSHAPSVAPTTSPSIAPSSLQSLCPSVAPTLLPSIAPSMTHSTTPSVIPSVLPTVIPSVVPSRAPTEAPSIAPSVSLAPVDSPSVKSSTMPNSVKPTAAFSVKPSPQVTAPPTTSFEGIAVDQPVVIKYVRKGAVADTNAAHRALRRLSLDVLVDISHTALNVAMSTVLSLSVSAVSIVREVLIDTNSTDGTSRVHVVFRIFVQKTDFPAQSFDSQHALFVSVTTVLTQATSDGSFDVALSAAASLYQAVELLIAQHDSTVVVAAPTYTAVDTRHIEDDDNDLSMGEYAGIGIGAFVGFILLIVCLWFVVKRNKQQQTINLTKVHVTTTGDHQKIDI